MEQNSLDVQVGGDHYKGTIQPFELSMANGHDSCTHAIQKYLTRFPRKDGIEGLKKAHHICNIRRDTIKRFGAPKPTRKPLILLGEYFNSNRPSPVAATAMACVEMWFRNPMTNHVLQAQRCRELIRAVAMEHYPDDYNEEDFL